MTFWNRSLVQKEAGVPLYQQLCEAIIQAVKMGVLQPHERIPSDRELCEELGMSRMTIRHAMAELVREGWLYSQAGKGTFVRGPKMRQRQQILVGFSQDWQQRGYHTHARVLTAQLVPAPASVADDLHVAVHEALVKLERLRFINDEPIAIEIVYLPYALVPGILEHDFSHESLYHVLRTKYNYQFAWARQVVEADMPTAREASLLTIMRNTPVLRGTRSLYMTDERVLEYSQAIYRGDRYRYETVLFERDWSLQGRVIGSPDELRAPNDEIPEGQPDKKPE